MTDTYAPRYIVIKRLWGSNDMEIHEGCCNIGMTRRFAESLYEPTGAPCTVTAYCRQTNGSLKVVWNSDTTLTAR
jgi:hypothetical protein